MLLTGAADGGRPSWRI